MVVKVPESAHEQQEAQVTQTTRQYRRIHAGRIRADPALLVGRAIACVDEHSRAWPLSRPGQGRESGQAMLLRPDRAPQPTTCMSPLAPIPPPRVEPPPRSGLPRPVRTFRLFLPQQTDPDGLYPGPARE